MHEVAHAAPVQPDTDVLTAPQLIDRGLVARDPAVGNLRDLGIGNGGSETTRDTVESIGQDASDALDNVMAEYLDIPATISVDQGAVVMVRVNTDLEMF